MGRIAAGLWAAVGFTACLETDVTRCAGGRVCGAEQRCTPDGDRCVSPEQLAACVGRGEGEACTLLAGDGRCRDAVCELAACGDGEVDALAGEVCDDGNAADGDGCARDCLSDETCGNGVRDATEQCDDGNTLDGDACQSSSTSASTTCHLPGCGDRVLDPDEVCDDGNAVDDDGCRSDCRSDETCGNAVTDFQVGEQCDDAGSMAADGCSAACELEVARWSPIVVDVPAARIDAAAAWDEHREEVVLFGGRVDDGAGTAPSDETWTWRAGGWSKRSPTTRPAAREAAVMAFDGARGETVMFGGYASTGVYDDTWRWDGASWTRALPTASPGPRRWAAMAYDAARRQTVLYGGGENLPASGTWLWDGDDWTRLADDGPGPRFASSAVFDPTLGWVVLVGGASTGYNAQLAGFRDDVWRWDGATWQALPVTGPTPGPRAGHQLVFDRARGQVLLIGGARQALGEDWSSSGPWSVTSGAGDTWAGTWDGASWRWEELPGAPLVARRQFALAAGPTPLLVGGVVDDGGTRIASAEVREWSDDSWTAPPSAPRPAAIRAAASAYDAWRGRLVIFGGIARSGALRSDTWEWDGFRWHALAPPISPSPRYAAMMAFDEKAGRSLMFGGADAATVLDDLWSWDGATWSLLTSGSGPPARNDGGMAYDRARGVTVLAAGYGDSYLADTWTWDGTAWTEGAALPVAPAGVAMGYDPIGERTLLFGGGIGGAQNLATFAWDGVAWTDVSSALRPNGRSRAALTWNGHRGTLMHFGAADDVWEWRGDAWQPLDALAIVGPRTNAATAYHPVAGALVTFGGQRDGDDVDELWELRLGVDAPEACARGIDSDGDGETGCADADCWARCTPSCAPGQVCDPDAPRCGDGACSALETCWLCPGDCGVCPAVCGDLTCDAVESAATCPGDCPP